MAAYTMACAVTLPSSLARLPNAQAGLQFFFLQSHSWNVAALITARSRQPSCSCNARGWKSAPACPWGQLWRTTELISRLQQKAVPLAPCSCGHPALGMTTTRGLLA